jgi:hypothetical protein
MDTLSALIQFTPKEKPGTGKIYGNNRNLKREVDAIRNNWFRDCTPIKKLTAEEKKKYDSKLIWWKDYIQGLKRRRQKCVKKQKVSGYNANTFTWDHESFKDRNALKFAIAVKNRVPRGRWLVLDDFSKKKKKAGCLRTLTAMKKFGLDASRVYVSNPGKSQVVAARRGGAVVEQSLCETAMKTVWKNVLFSAAYLDICGGSLCYLESLIDKVLFRRSIRGNHINGGKFVLGLTLTSRDSQGQNMVERLLATRIMMKKKGFTELESSPSSYFKPKSIITMFYVR